MAERGSLSSSEEDFDKGMGDDEDWGKDLGLDELTPFKLPGLPTGRRGTLLEKKPSVIFPDGSDLDLDDWSKDFPEESNITPPLIITGIKADPSMMEDDWGGDFDWGPEDKGLVNMNTKLNSGRPGTPLALSRNLSASVISVGSNEQALKEVLQRFPDCTGPNKISRKPPKLNDASNAKLQESKGIWDVGILSYDMKEYSDAMKQFQKAQQVFQSVTGASEFAFETELLYYLGNTAHNLSRYTEAIGYLKQASDASGVKRAKHGVRGRLNLSLARCFLSTENYNMAAHHFAEALRDIFKSRSNKLDWLEIDKACLGLGIACKKLQWPDLARDYYKQALNISQKIGNETLGTEAKNALKGFVSTTPEVSDVEISGTEDENWDDEFGFDDSQRTALALPGQSGAPSSPTSPIKQKMADENILPLKLRLIESTRKHLEIIKFPKATTFTTLTKQHRLNEEELSGWLKTLVRKHKNREIPGKISQNDNEIKLELARTLKTMEKFSTEWALTNYYTCYWLSRQKRHEKLWEVLFDCFIDVESNGDKFRDRDPNFIYIMLQIVYLAAKNWALNEDRMFLQITHSMKYIDPNQADAMTLLVQEAKAHHEYETLDRGAFEIIENFAKIYKGNKTEEELAEVKQIRAKDISLKETAPSEIQARALCDIHFLLADISPLRCQSRDSTEDDEDERKGFTGTEHNLRFDQVSDLVDASTRYENLLHLYSRINPSFLKAKTAYALGHHAAYGLMDTRLAEQYFFECVFILDSLPTIIPGFPPLVSELGTNALTKYGDMLLTNQKYPYAMASYSSAAKCCRLRKTGYYSLVRRLATIAMDNNDYSKSLEYFEKVLKQYGEEKKDNEKRFVAETMSTLAQAKGDFGEADARIGEALELVPQSSSDKMDPISFRLHMKAADLYLDSNDYEKGIELLEALVNVNRNYLPHGGRPLVLTKLAKAYIKKRWYRECAHCLQRLDAESETNQGGPGFTSPTTKSAASLGDKKKIKYWELSALNYYHSEQYADAFCCIEWAIQECPSSALSSRAQFYFLRGKIFQALATSTSIIFPTHLKPNSDRNQPISQIRYSGIGDFIQECLWSYDKAYNYFKAIGDDLHIAKTTNRIAATYLDRVFAPVALLHIPFNDLCKFPIFNIVAKDREETVRKPTPRHSRSKSEGGVLDKKDVFFEISFDRIERPAMCGLEIASDMGHPVLILSSYLNMAELRYLTGDNDLSIAFWQECKDQLFLLFFDGPEFLGKNWPPHILRKFSVMMNRLTRLLFCYDSDFINKNLQVIDAMILLQNDVEQANRRPLAPLRSERGPEEGDKEGTKSNSYGKSNAKPPSLATSTYPPSGAGSAPKTPRPNVQNLFGDGDAKGSSSSLVDDIDQEGSPVNNLTLSSSIERVRDETSSRLWSLFYAIKVEIQNYIQGKLSQEEVLALNRKLLQKFFTVKNANDTVKSNILLGKPVTNNSQQLTRSRSNSGPPVGPYFDAVLQVYKDVAKLVYILQVGDLVVYYVPSTGQKRIQRFGGRDIAQPPGWSLNLNIHFMSDNDEFVSLQVSPTMTLDGILKYLCNKPYWEVEDVKKKSGFWGSLGRNQSNPNILKNKPKYVDRTKEFHNRLGNLLGILGHQLPNAQENAKLVKERNLTSAHLSQIAFAKRAGNEFASSSSFTALTVSSHTTVSQCFSSGEMKSSNLDNPLQLFIYISRNSDDSELQNSGVPKNEAVNRTLLLNQDIVEYLETLVSKDANDDTDLSKRLISDLVDRVFTTLIDIIPYTEKPAHLSSLDKSGMRSVGTPLSLICSGSMQLFPWELILPNLGEHVIRYISLQDMLAHFEHCAKKSTETDIVPRYWSCYVSSNERNFLTDEDKRRDFLPRELFYHLQVSPKPQTCPRYSRIVTPYHTPLMKHGKRMTAYKKQYKMINWFDVGMMDSRHDLLELLRTSRIAETPGTIFLLTFADMLECTELQLLLMRCLPNCTFIFIPASKMKTVVVKMLKNQEDFMKAKTKPTTNMFEFLMSSITMIQAECATPIAVFNPPRTVK